MLASASVGLLSLNGGAGTQTHTRLRRIKSAVPPRNTAPIDAGSGTLELPLASKSSARTPLLPPGPWFWINSSV